MRQGGVSPATEEVAGGHAVVGGQFRSFFPFFLEILRIFLSGLTRGT
jgi:hypothetical protein